MEENYLTPAEAAEQKGVSIQAIYKAVKENRLPAIRWMGRIALRPADVEAFLPGSYGGITRASIRRSLGRPKKQP